MKTLASLLALLAASACTRASSDEAPADARGAASALVRCALDEVREGDAAGAEAAIRREIRGDRYRFSVRAGRCASAVSDALSARDASARALHEAWEALLPLAQATDPQDIALERAIRRVGNALRACH